MQTSPLSPGVYINEVDAFLNSAVQVATAVPAFIGYTPQAKFKGKSCLFQPMKITSVAEFMAIYGYPVDLTTQKTTPKYTPTYWITRQKKKPAKGGSYTIHGDIYTIEPDPNTIYYLYNSLLLYFQNGGSEAYIVSIGTYGPPSGQAISPGDQIINPNVLLRDMEKGLTALKNVSEVTMYVCPDAMLLSPAENSTWMEMTLMQCGSMGTTVAIFDIIGAREPDPILWTADIANFRNATGNNFLSYGVAYYPYLITTVVPIDQVSYANINGGDVSALIPMVNPPSAPNAAAESLIKNIAAGNQLTIAQNSDALSSLSQTYKQILGIVQAKINTLPPSGVMAGVYSLVDAMQGVWVAPANVSPVGVMDLTLRIDDVEQANLTVDAVSGKSINAIRFFNGQGVLVWGARTMDGNSQDWRYINVRRTVTMIEQSAKLALGNFVFSPNTADTWMTIKSMLVNFLTNLWRAGALQGSAPADAFNVAIGLGTTMTEQDILDGYLRVTIFLAVSHPAEFIVVTLEQKLANP